MSPPGDSDDAACAQYAAGIISAAAAAAAAAAATPQLLRQLQQLVQLDAVCAAKVSLLAVSLLDAALGFSAVTRFAACLLLQCFWAFEPEAPFGEKP